jgi:hypothetical protein
VKCEPTDRVGRTETIRTAHSARFVANDTTTRATSHDLVLRYHRLYTVYTLDTKKAARKSAPTSGSLGTVAVREIAQDFQNMNLGSSTLKPKMFSFDLSLADEKAAVLTVGENFGIAEDHSAALVKLAKTLKVDDPAIFLTFRAGPGIRRALTSRMTPNGPIVVQGRPCLPGAHGNAALQNIKEWVCDQIPDGKEALPIGDSAYAIGNLTQDEYNDLAVALSFNKDPAVTWGVANVVNNSSLGGIIGITGTGVGQATLGVLPSIGFRD